METFSGIFRRWLGDRTPESAAPELAISPRTARYWYDGEVTPPATRVPHLAQVLGVDQATLTAALHEAQR